MEQLIAKWREFRKEWNELPENRKTEGRVFYIKRPTFSDFMEWLSK